jgi:hypothetical protein
MSFKTNDLIKIINRNNDPSHEIYGKILGIHKNYYIIGIGRLGKFNFNIKDFKKKISWGNYTELPKDELKLLQNDVLIKFNKNDKNRHLYKRTNELNINDIILLRVSKQKKNIVSFNDSNKLIFKIPNIEDKGIKCKIININLWEPSSTIEYKSKTFNIIPGSFMVVTGDYINKIPDANEIITNTLYNRYDITKQTKEEILQGNCIFNIHFRDIDLMFDIKKLSL